MKRFWFTILLLVLASVSKGQTIAPPIAEYKMKPGKFAKGSFQIQNNSLGPVAFSAESYRMVFENGQPRFQAPDASMLIILSETSGRLGPKEIRRIDYKISCTFVPCQATIKVGLITGHTANGMAVRVIVPHVVYLGTSRSPRHDALAAAGIPIK